MPSALLAWIEVVVNLHVAHGSIGLQVVLANHARAAFGAVGFNQIQNLVVR